MTTIYDPHHPLYLDEADTRKELERVYDLCHGCRLCFKFCPSFPTLFSYVDMHDDQDAGKMTPAQVESIKLAEVGFQKFCKTHQIDVMKIEAADRDSARGMHMTVRSHVPAALTYLLTFGIFSVLASMFVWPEVKESTPMMYILGSLNTAWTGACAFWFGTTSGSQNKNEMLAKASFK